MQEKRKKVGYPKADLSEKYSIVQDESEWEYGHVVCVNRDESIEGDVELSPEVGSTVVVGVISEDPAFAMNRSMDGTVDIAIKGRVPCKVQGPVAKGVNLISGEDGIAIPVSDDFDTFGSWPLPSFLTKVFAITNESIDTADVELIEVII